MRMGSTIRETVISKSNSVLAALDMPVIGAEER